MLTLSPINSFLQKKSTYLCLCVQRSMGLLRDTERQLRSQHSARTGIEKLAFFVRRSEALLRRAAASSMRESSALQVAVEEVADLQAK